jgi:DNA invertase Pin-like site-specific DNA recombinase
VRQLGYTRVSTSSQHAQLQLDALIAAGVQKRDVFADVTSGSKTAIERPGMKGSSCTPRRATLSL